MKKLLAPTVWDLLISVVIVTVGCGGRVIGGDRGGSGGSSGTAGSGGMSGAGGTAGSGPVDAGAGCPADMPARGMSCDSPGVWCEYGDWSSPGCNAIYQCLTTSARWQRESIGTCDG